MDAVAVGLCWARFRRVRYGIAAVLAIAGALLWTMQALGAWLQSQEGKWQHSDYLAFGSTTLDADDLLTMLSRASLLVAALLGWGTVSLLLGLPSGRPVLLTGAWLVVLGQLFAAVLAWIPVNAFYHHSPANLVFLTPLVTFPLLLILCLTNRRPRLRRQSTKAD
ncbi:hypothetical protein ACFO5K_05885 [Nocardia halotolerans]|uniref:Uncharacterized protein n=1 Tax=Nocardia halotolerans TaxID=1755878 RepID=A0ABV8VFX6_9NOCA